MARRSALRLMIGGAVVLTGCVVEEVPVADPAPTPTATPAATPSPTALPRPTQTPLSLPTIVPTRIPNFVPTAAPTPTWSVQTAAPPPGLAAAIDRAMRSAIQAGATPGGVVTIWHKSVQIFLQAYGTSRKYESADTPVATPIDASTDSLYDLASITKLFTTTCVMRLVEQNKLGMDEPLATWLPEFAAGGKDDVTLRHLLTHTSGLPADVPLWKLADNPDARFQRELETPLTRPPGTRYLYSDLGLIAIGHLLEYLHGARLDAIVRDAVTGPLGLGRTTYVPSQRLRSRIAATEFETDPPRGMVWGEVDDANAWALGGIAGHAGLFSTAQDLARFGQMYLQGGTIDGVRVLAETTVAEMTRNQIGKLGWRGLAWELNASFYMGKLARSTTFGHTGYTGTSLVVDPGRELVVVLLTNRVHPTPNGPSINGLRNAVANAVLAVT